MANPSPKNFTKKITLHVTSEQHEALMKQAQNEGRSAQELLRGYMMVGLIYDMQWPAIKNSVKHLSVDSYQWIQDKVKNMIGEKITL